MKARPGDQPRHTSGATMSDWQELDEANRLAIRALIGRSENPVGELVSFFRSGAEIHPQLREYLADALEGTSFFHVRLKLSGHKRNNDLERGLRSRERAMVIGRWIDGRIDKPGSRTAAVRDAAAHFHTGEETASNALDYFRRAKSWIDSVKVEGTYLASQLDEQLEHFFHISDRDVTNLPQNCSLEDHYERIFISICDGEFWRGMSKADRALILKSQGIPEDSPWFGIGLNIE
jgi:hypothetical protein